MCRKALCGGDFLDDSGIGNKMLDSPTPTSGDVKKRSIASDHSISRPVSSIPRSAYLENAWSNNPLTAMTQTRITSARTGTKLRFRTLRHPTVIAKTAPRSGPRSTVRVTTNKHTTANDQAPIRKEFRRASMPKMVKKTAQKANQSARPAGCANCPCTAISTRAISTPPGAAAGLKPTSPNV